MDRAGEGRPRRLYTVNFYCPQRRTIVEETTFAVDMRDAIERCGISVGVIAAVIPEPVVEE